MSDLATSGHLRQPTTQLPASWYCDPQVFDAEQRLLLARAPSYVGHELMVPNPGDFKRSSMVGVAHMGTTTTSILQDCLVRPGDRIPLIPKHTGLLVLDYELGKRWDIGGNLIAASGAYLHGNENNANQAGGTNGAGTYIAGTGWIPGYTVVNLQSTYHVTKHADILKPGAGRHP